MVTIRDVAKMAGVSRSTVSLVLNNSLLIKEKTRQKVQDIIKETNFVPNNSARSLSSKVTYSLGIIVVLSEVSQNKNYEYIHETKIYSQDIIAGISGVLAGSKYKLLEERFCINEAKGDLPKIIKNRLIDGALIVGTLYDESFIDLMLSWNKSLIVVGGHKENKVDSVNPDPGKGVELAAEKLIETGHKNICLVNAPKIFRSSVDRLVALKEIQKKSPKDIAWPLVYAPSNTGEGGYRAMKELYDSGNQPDGIIAGNTMIAMGILRYLYERGIRVPDDVSIIAYEDSILSGYSYPAMSAINIQKEYMGELAASMLLERMEKPNKEITNIVVDPFLVSRDSVRDRRSV